MKKHSMYSAFLFLRLMLIISFSALLATISPRAHATAPQTLSTPTIRSVSPDHIFNNRATTITITGSGFIPTPTITISAVPMLCETPLEDVKLLDNGALRATVPANLYEGSYALKITNPDGGFTQHFGVLTLMRTGDGSFGPWEATESMETGRWNFTAVRVRDHIYALGGNGRDSSETLRTVEVARINGDGSLDEWETTASLSSARHSFAAVAYGDFIYVIGGQSDTNSRLLNTVEQARVNANGTLTQWRLMPSLTTPRANLAAVAANGYLYALGGNGASVERAPIYENGTLGPWEIISWMAVQRSGFAAVSAGNAIYALGGDRVGQANSVEWAKIGDDGSIGPWQFTSSLTTERVSHAAVSLDGSIYALGSLYPSILSTNSVERTSIRPDGTLGLWQLTASMRTPRSNFVAVTANNYVYALGGFTGHSPTLRSVEYAPVRGRAVYLPIVVR